MNRRAFRRSGTFDATAAGPTYRTVGLSAIVRFGTFPVTALATFATTAITIRYAGAEGFAVVAVIATLSQLVPYADLGIGAGVVNAIAGGERGDHSRVAAVASALRVLIMSALVVALVALAGVTMFSWRDVLGLNESSMEYIDLVTLGAVLLFAVSIPLGIGQRVLIGLMRNPQAVAIGAMTPVLSLVATVVISSLQLPPAMLALSAPVGGLLTAGFASMLAVRAVEFRLKYIFSYRLYRYTGLVRQGLWYLLAVLTGASTLQYGRVILASNGSLTDAADFSLVMQFYAPMWSFFLVSGTALWPIFTKKRMNNEEKRGRALLPIIGIFLLGGLACLGGLTLAGPLLAELLSEGQVQPEIGVFVFCGVLVTVQAVQLVFSVFLTTTADFRYQALFGVPLATTGLLGAVLLAPVVGASAPFISTSIALLLFGILPCLVRVLRLNRLPAVAPDSLGQGGTAPITPIGPRNENSREI